MRPKVEVAPITFDASDLEPVCGPHHDSLVIKIQIGWATISSVLVDGGIAVNIVMLEALQSMGISEDKIVRKSSMLVGFSGESKHSVGEITLPVYVDGATSLEGFVVLDCLSTYNVILGRPWIHNNKVMPSTYHQCVKIPTPWRVTTVRGEQQQAKECYMTSLKPKYTNQNPAGKDVTPMSQDVPGASTLPQGKTQA